ncbi:Lrp/AsnC family transcriptional regulator [Streptomyces sp. NPDC087440]|uniref:Lrp/AsnC family transcriptional regulator n=1 Tax=Streptomyces sp. NPDC087440 TaxID=3365790 RepID=UPI003812E757
MTSDEGQDPGVLSEADLALLQAMQLSPRARWKDIGDTLGIDPVTAARRWRRLEADGRVWTTCGPALENTTAFAYVEIRCAHGAVSRVAAQIARMPHAMTVDLTSGEQDLLVTVIARDPVELSDFVLDGLARVEGIRSTVTHPIVTLHVEASQWHVRILGRRQVDGIRASADPAQRGRPAARLQRLDDADWEMALRLGLDGRTPLAELAAAAGMSESKAQRRLRLLQSRGQLRVRAEVSRFASPTPVLAWLFADTPTTRTAEVAARLSLCPEIRAVASLVGRRQLLLAVWVTSTDHLRLFEAKVEENLPHVTITDRRLVIRPVKRMGRILDRRGRAVEHVPVDLRIPAAGPWDHLT